jgi:hypothetical protein
MKKMTFLVLIGLFVLGCKKYENDPFISTYSPEARLIKGDSCVWTCVQYLANNGAARDIPAFHYSLSFKDDKSAIAGFADLGTFFEISDSNEWTLGNRKETLSFFGDYEIKKLTMRELELKDSNGNIYLFEKRKKEAISELDEGIMNFPMFGLFNEIVELKDYYSCQFPGQVQAWNSSTNANLNTMEGVLGNGIGGAGSTFGEVKNYKYSFSRNFEKSGYITFWIEIYDSSPIIKINGSEINDFEYMIGPKLGQSRNWCSIKININSPGNKTILLEGGNVGGDYKAVLTIDEICFWEFH